MKRCSWAQGPDMLIRQYHDTEYGRKKKSDMQLFEKLCLEIFQAGLSWRTVLYKRDALRDWFFGFETGQGSGYRSSAYREDAWRCTNNKEQKKNRSRGEQCAYAP